MRSRPYTEVLTRPATLNRVQWYNENRLHSRLDYLTPLEYEGEYYRDNTSEQQPLPGELSLYWTRGASSSLARPVTLHVAGRFRRTCEQVPQDETADLHAQEPDGWPTLNPIQSVWSPGRSRPPAQQSVMGQNHTGKARVGTAACGTVRHFS